MFDNMLSNLVVAWNPFSAIWEFIKQVEGWIMNVIFMFFQNVFGIQNIGLSIVFFTVVVYTLMLPLNYKQQKFSHMNKVMSPEIKKIQAKYKGKQDQESMMKQNEELQAVYAKYGVSPSGSCVQMIITLPILFALYRIIYNIPAYVDSVRAMYDNLVTQIMATSGYEDVIREIGNSLRTVNTSGEMNANLVTQILYNFKSSDWGILAEKFPNISSDIINSTQNAVERANQFLLLNIAESPSSTFTQCMSNGISGIFQGTTWLVLLFAVLIPVLSGLFQWLSVKTMPQAEVDPNSNSAADTTANTMKTMNNVMPIISVVMCFTLPLGVGIYWTASSMYRFISSLIMNKKLDKMDMDEVLKKNLEKVNAKRAKQGLPPQKVASRANVSTKDLEADKKEEKNISKIQENMKKSTDYYNQKSSNPNSISAKANMVRQFDERNTKKK